MASMVNSTTSPNLPTIIVSNIQESTNSTNSVFAVDDDCDHIKSELKKQYKYLNLKGFIISGVLATAVVIVVFTLCCVAVVQIATNRFQADRRKAEQMAVQAQLSIEKQIESSFVANAIIGQVITELNYNITKDRANQLFQRVSKLFPDLKRFQIAPNNIISFVYPLEGNEGLIGTNKSAQANQVSSIQRAIANRKMTLAGPLLSVLNQVILLGQYPIFYPAIFSKDNDIRLSSSFKGYSDNNGGLWGFVTSTYGFKELFDSIDLPTILDGYQYQFYDYDNKFIFIQSKKTENGTVDYESTFNKTVAPITRAITKNITIFDATWSISLIPIGGWAVDPIFYLEVVVVFVLNISLFFSVLFTVQKLYVHYYRKNEYELIQNKLEQKVAERTKELEKNHQELQLLLERVSIEEQRTRKIVNSINDILITVKQNGNIAHCNTSFYKLFHFNESDMLKGIVTISKVIPSLEEDLNNLFKDVTNKILQSKQQNSSLKKEIDTVITYPSKHVIAFSKHGKEIPVLINFNFCTLYVNDLFKLPKGSRKRISFETISKTKMFEKELVCIVTLHVDASILQSMQQQQHNQQVDEGNSSERMEFYEMFSNLQKRKEFKEFCIKERNEENVCFLEDIELYKSLTNTNERVTMQNEVFDKYLGQDSIKQLNVSKEVFETQLIKIAKGLGELELFDELEKAVIDNMLYDVFKRWLQVQQKKEMELFL
ncbi:hypothetical protein ABK040_008057 [Willaertia magna]